MSSRFEKVIATAVLAGALALTACSSEDAEILPTYNAGTSFNPAPSSTATTGGGGGGPPVLLSARTIGPGKDLVELSYSEPMVAGPAAAGMFTLNRNSVNFGVNFSLGNYYITPFTYFYPTNVNPFYSFGPAGGAGSAIASAYVSSGDNTRVILKLFLPLLEGDDAATGMLRLSFTNAANGIEDQAGNAAPDIAPPPASSRGNVVDTTGAPALINATTLPNGNVELTFSEKVTTATPALAAGDFTITENFGVSTIATNPSFVNYNFSYSPYSYFAGRGYYVYNMANLLTTAQQLKIILTTQWPIRGVADWGTGRLRLTYTGGASPITDLGGTPLQPIANPPQMRGRIIDTLP